MRAGGLTFAPEAGTQRMRDVITKNVTEEDIIESAHRVFSRGFHRMKLYFMIGLPTETDEDVRGIVETAARVQAIGRRYQAGAVVTASVSTHVPKPHTPFQWAAMDSEAETARKQGLLAQAAQKLRVDLKMHENYQSHLEAVFSRGDRDVSDVLERAFRLGCRFDSWDEQLRMDLWDQAISEIQAASGLEVERYLGTIPVTAHLPWDHIDIDLEPDFLLKEYRKALKDRLSPPCGKPYKKLLHPSSVAAAEAGHKDKLICYDCGVACDLGGMKEERLFYLRRMNAWTKPVDAAPVARMGDPAAADEAMEGADRAGATGGGRAKRSARTQPPTRIAQGEAYRVRLRYTKLGRVAFLGHLDLVRHLPRIFRRAGVDLKYSIGFHPKPELSFGPALGLGIPSLGELLDVKLGEPIAASELARRLQLVTLDGVNWLGGVALGHNDRALGRVIARAEFWARLPAGISARPGVEIATGGQPITVKRRGEGSGVGRMIDVRRALVSMATPVAGTLETTRACRQLEWDPSGESEADLVRFHLAVSAEGSAKPIEVIESLWGPDVAAQTSIARVALWGTDGNRLIDPLDADSLRQAVSIVPVPADAPLAAEAVGAIAL
jgi:radical SAM-linked protein